MDVGDGSGRAACGTDGVDAVVTGTGVGADGRAAVGAGATAGTCAVVARAGRAGAATGVDAGDDAAAGVDGIAVSGRGADVGGVGTGIRADSTGDGGAGGVARAASVDARVAVAGGRCGPGCCAGAVPVVDTPDGDDGEDADASRAAGARAGAGVCDGDGETRCGAMAGGVGGFAGVVARGAGLTPVDDEVGVGTSPVGVVDRVAAVVAAATSTDARVGAAAAAGGVGIAAGVLVGADVGAAVDSSAGAGVEVPAGVVNAGSPPANGRAAADRARGAAGRFGVGAGVPSAVDVAGSALATRGARARVGAGASTVDGASASRVRRAATSVGVPSSVAFAGFVAGARRRGVGDSGVSLMARSVAGHARSACARCRVAQACFVKGVVSCGRSVAMCGTFVESDPCSYASFRRFDADVRGICHHRHAADERRYGAGRFFTGHLPRAIAQQRSLAVRAGVIALMYSGAAFGGDDGGIAAVAPPARMR